jgi:hypothetical protein
MFLKKSGLTPKLRREIPTFGFAAKKPPERGVSSPYLSRTKPPSVLAGEANLTALASVCAAAFEQRRNILIGPGESPVGEQAQGEKFEAEQDRQGQCCFLDA